MQYIKGIALTDKLYSALMVIILLLFLGGCDKNSVLDNGVISSDTLSASLPNLLKTQTLNESNLRVEVIVDGGAAQLCTNLLVNQVNGTYSCSITLSAGEHVVSLVYSVIDPTYGTVRVATISGINVSVVTDQTTEADFGTAMLAYDDGDGDGVSNLDELRNDSDPGISDTTPPTVSNPLPSINATDVALGTSIIKIEFSEAMNPDSINTDSFTLSSLFSEVPGSVLYDDVTNTATLTLGAKLIDNLDYIVTITTGVKDKTGNALSGDYIWSFHTANIVWFKENSSIVKLSSAQEELIKVDQINCRPAYSYTQFAIDESNGSLWVSETNGNRVIKLNSQGELLILLNQNSAQGTAIDPRDGGIWTSEYVSGLSRKLIKRDSLGFPVLETALGNKGSMMDNAMTWYEGDNSLWFADYSNNVVKVFGTDSNLSGYDLSGPSGSQHLRIGSFVGQPFTVSAYPGLLGSEGFVWASDRDGAVVKLAINGTELFRRSPSGFFEVRHVSADIADGSVWIGDGNSDRIAKYSANGDELVNKGGFRYFRAVESDSLDGGAWVGYYDSSNNGGGLVKLSSTGTEEWRRVNTGGEVSSIALQVKSSQRTTIYVGESGSDENGFGLQSSPYRTISKAVSMAGSGGLVIVEAGTYNENVQLKSGVEIKGAGYAGTLIQGLGTTNVIDGTGVVNASISGFAITGSGDTESGIYCADCKGLIIEDNWIGDNGNSTTSNGIVIQGATTALVQHNVITNNANGGMYISGDSQLIVRNNIIANNGDTGIYRGGRTTNRLTSYIINNVIDSNGTEPGGRSGIMTFSDDVISNNIIANNGASNPNAGLSVGIYVSGFGWTPDVTLSYNNVWNNFQGSYTGVSSGTGDISSDPLFEAGGQYSLDVSSPSINTGDAKLYDAGVDCSVNPTSRSDMGAYGGPWGSW